MRNSMKITGTRSEHDRSVKITALRAPRRELWCIHQPRQPMKSERGKVREREGKIEV